MDAAQLQAQTSLNIFRSFMKQNPDGTLDARGVISNECYKAWLRSRKSLPSCPEKAFQRALSGHLTGVDGRVPFDEDEEEAILKVLRKKARWECFKHCEVKFGESGFRAKGFHEKALTGEILKSRPKKRAKRAIERLRKLSRLASDEDAFSENSEDHNSEDDEEEKPRRRKIVRHNSEEDNEDEDDEEVEGDSDDSVSTSSRTNDRPSKNEEEEDLTETESDYQASYPSAQDSSVRALQMQIPVAPQPLAVPALKVLTVLVNMMVSMAAAGLPWAQSLSSLARTVMLTRGWFGSPDVNKCQHIVNRLTRQYPGYYVLVHDFTSNDCSGRILLQNDEAVRVFGPISQSHGGFKGVRAPPEDLWKILRALSEVLTNPSNVEQKFETRLFGRNGIISVEGTITIDDANKILIERCKVVSESSASQAVSGGIAMVSGASATTMPQLARPFHMGPAGAGAPRAPSLPTTTTLQPHLLRPAFAPPFAQGLPRPPVPMSHPRLGFWH